MAVGVRPSRSRASRPRGPTLLERAQRWPGQWTTDARLAIGVTTLFLCLTLWWVLRDESVPISDAGFHLEVMIEVFKDLQAGHFSQAVAPHLQYPPLVYLVGAAGDYLGGLSIHSMVMAENLFYVPLLALGCYNIGRLAFGTRAGLLAVIFALGSPLVARLFHLTMLDAPQASIAAASIWLVLDTRYFTRLRWCAAAGLMVGLGLLTKESLALFVAGPLLVTFVRGGWRSWRGIAVFAVVVFVVAGPWYLNDFSQVKEIGSGVATAGTATTSGIAPPRLALDNLDWYLWSFASVQIYLPLMLFAIVGWVWALVGFVRRRWVSPYAPELVVGAFVAWLALTETFVHDNRYGMSMLVYFAVFGSFWIVRLPRTWSMVATTALVAVALANTLGSTFGVGGIVTVSLPHSLQRIKEAPNAVTIYSNEGYLVHAAPQRTGYMLGALRVLKHNGVEGVLVLPSEAPNEAAFLEGLQPLTQIAGLELGESAAPSNLSNAVAVLDREKVSKNAAPPCVVLSDGTGVWIRIGNPYAPGAKDYCPTHKPQFYTR